MLQREKSEPLETKFWNLIKKARFFYFLNQNTVGILGKKIKFWGEKVWKPRKKFIIIQKIEKDLKSISSAQTFGKN